MSFSAHILNSSKTRVADLPTAVWEFSRTLKIRDAIRLTTTEEDKFSLIVANQTFVRILDSLDATNIQTYRITKVSTQHVNGQYALTVTGNRIWQDMNTQTYPFQRSWNSVPAGDLVSELMDYSQFQVGATIAANTTPIDLITSKFDSVLSLVQEVGDLLDLDIDIDETTSPETIDLITKGSDNGVRFEVGHSIPGLSIDTDRDKVRNQIYPIGTGDPGATCEGAIFEVESVSTDTITVKGDKCIPSDDTFTDGFKVEMLSGAADGTRYTISATTRGSSPDTDTITTSTSPNFATDGVAAGDLFKFVDSSNEDFPFVPDLASQNEYGVRDEKVETQIQGVNTLVNPGFMDGTYTAGLHAGLSKVGTPTVTEETDVAYFRHGSKSQKVVASTADHGVSFTVTLDGSEYFSQMVHLYISSGSVKVKVTRGNLTFETTGTSGTGWFTEHLENMKLGTGTATVSVLANGGAATWWLDARSFVGGPQNQTFVQYNGARELYRAAFEELEKKKSAQIEYTVPNAMDLYREDPRKFPFREVNDGDTIGLVDHKQGVAVSVRILSINKNQDDDSLRVAFASQTRLEAALRTLNRHEAEAYMSRKAARGAAIQSATTQQQINEINTKITNLAPTQTLNTQSTSTVKSTSYNSINVSAGTLQSGKFGTFTLDGNDITGLTADTLYYLYFNPAEDSSGVQASDDPADAYAQGNVWLGIARTGTTSNDAVQIVLSTANENQGEIKTKGVEVFDDSDVKRIDSGILQDISALSLGVPIAYGMQLTNGVLIQYNDGLSEYTGTYPGYHRRLYADHGAGATTQVLYGDSVTVFATSSTFLYGHHAYAWNQGAGEAVAYRADALGSGAGDVYGFQAISVVGVDGDVVGFGIRPTNFVKSTGTGDAYAFYVPASGVQATGSGTAYAFRDESGARGYFAGNLSVRGLDYVWPSSLPGSDSYLVCDSSGNLSFNSVGSGVVDGAGTANYLPLWSDPDTLTDSIIQQSSGKIGIGSGFGTFDGKFHVRSDDNVWGGVFYGGSTTGQSLGVVVNAGTNASDTSFLVQDRTGTYNYLYVTGGGNIGIAGYVAIGIAVGSVASPLHVQSSLTNWIAQSTNTHANGYGLLARTTGHSSNSYYTLATENSVGYTFIVDGAGSISVGASTAATSYAGAGVSKVFDLQGGGTFGAVSLSMRGGSSWTNPNWEIYHDNVTGAYLNLSIGNGGSRYVSVDYNGNFGVGITPSYKLDVNGGTNMTFNLTGTSTSNQAHRLRAHKDGHNITSSEHVWAIETYADISSSASQVGGLLWQNHASANSGSTNLWVQVHNGSSLITQAGFRADGRLTVHSAGSSLVGNAYLIGSFTNTAESRGIHLGFDATSSPQHGVIASAGASVGIGFYTHDGSSYAARNYIAYNGQNGIGTTNVTSFPSSAYKLIVGDGSSAGQYVTVYTGTSGIGHYTFADGTSSADATRGAISYSHVTNLMYFSTDATARVYLDGTGLGIGTVASWPLDVIGGGHFYGTSTSQEMLRLTVEDDSIGGPTMVFYHNTTTPANLDVIGIIQFDSRNSTPAQQTYARIDAIVKTTTAGSVDGLLNLVVVENSVAHNYISMDGSAVTTTIRGDVLPWSNATYDLGSGTKQWANIHAGAIALGVGTGTTVYSFESWVTGSAFPYMRIYNGTTNSNVGVIMQNDAAQWFTFVDGGNVDRMSWYISGATKMYLTTAGASYNTTGTWGTISDVRLKHTIEDARDYWDDFRLLEFKTFYMTTDSKPFKRFGLIAQHTHTIFPSCVDTSAEYWAIKQSVIHNIGLKVLQEAQDKIDDNRSEIEALQSRVDELETQVAILKQAA